MIKQKLIRRAKRCWDTIVFQRKTRLEVARQIREHRKMMRANNQSIKKNMIEQNELVKNPSSDPQIQQALIKFMHKLEAKEREVWENHLLEIKKLQWYGNGWLIQLPPTNTENPKK